jgi:Interferon-induced transmembrane protein.
MVPAPLAEPSKIQNYLVQSILVTLCCCMPAGIVAIIYAAQVNVSLYDGQTV